MGYNTPKTAIDCDVYRQSQPMSRAKTETETSESEKMFAQRPSASVHVTSLNPSKIALAYHATVTQCTEATKKAKQHHQTGLNLFIRHFWCRRVWFLKKCLIDSYQCCVYKTSRFGLGPGHWLALAVNIAI